MSTLSGAGLAFELRNAALYRGSRPIWSDLTLLAEHGEFIAVLGPNGSGKTTLLRAVLGLEALTDGTVSVAGGPVQRHRRRIGYVRQEHRLAPFTPLRARDLVRAGLDGHRWGFAMPGTVPWKLVDDALAAVDATHLADTPVGMLSGGEQQRVRVAQALIGDPILLLCDEPLLSLDMSSQRAITELVDRRRREHGTAVMFVTHEINPVLPYVDRVLYLAGGRAVVGSVDEVLNSETLSELYGSPIEVIRRDASILVAGIPANHHDDIVATDMPRQP